MKEFVPLSTDNLLVNPVNIMANDWMLITAGDKDSFNTMTASWGGIGNLWNRAVVFTFVRPQRFTYGFMEKNDFFSLSFFEGSYRQALNICGTKSGRDTDKVKEAGLTAVFSPEGTPFFREANLIFECRKVYSQQLMEENFADSSMLNKFYPHKDIHKQYIGEIVNAWTKIT